MIKIYKGYLLRWVIGMIAVLGSPLVPMLVEATPVIDFTTGNAGVGGTIILWPGQNVSGSGIPVDTLVVTGTNADGVYDLSGVSVSSTAVGGNSAVLAFDSRGTPFITVTGGVPSLGIPNGTVLLSGPVGSFPGFSILQPLSNVLSVSGSGADTKDPLLLQKLGLPTDLLFNFYGFTITANFNPQTNQGDAISTDFTNTAIPEPASMLLLGSGLIGLAGYARRRFKK